MQNNRPFKKVLVTGAAGFIGSNLAETLLNQGCEVVCLDNFVNGKLENLYPWYADEQCKFFNLPVTLSADWESTDFSAAVQKVDVVFHLAASKCTVCRENPKLDLMTNAWGTFRMAEVARKVGAKFIHVSTGSVMNGKPISYYGVSKLAGESYLRAVAEYYPHFNFTVVRVYHVYGPRQDDSDKGGVVPIFIRQAYNQQPLTIHGDGMQVRHFTYVQDVVNALIYVACGNYHAKYFDFFNRDKTTIFNLARKVSRLMNADTFCFKFSDPRPGDIKNFDQKPTLDSASGFMDLEFGLKKTIDWYLEQYEWKRGNISMCSY